MKMHVNFHAHDIEKSVAFYATLLQAQPLKHFDDYALFVTENPPLELALDRDATASPGVDAHYGLVVESPESVESAIERLANAGIATDVERDETCCYARQTKVWAADPDGRRWEVYTVHEDTEIRDDRESACCSTEADANECCAV